MVSKEEKKEILQWALKNADDFLLGYYKNHPNKKYAEHYLITNAVAQSVDFTDEEYEQLCEEEEKAFGYTKEEWEYELKTLGQINNRYRSDCEKALKELQKK